MKPRISHIPYLLMFLLGVSCSPARHWNLTAGQHPEPYTVRHTTLNDTILLYLPHGYGTRTKEWPLIVFLHGKGERGNDIRKVKVHGPPELVEHWPDFGFIVASPQNLLDTFWSPASVNRLIEVLVHKLKVDRDRIYLTGLSMGGRGTWKVAAAYPHWFAALAPVCGEGDTTTVCAVKNIPVWAFHGAKDDVIPLRGGEAMVRTLNRCGGHAKLTVYPELGHNAWDSAYVGVELYEWFLGQVK